MDSHPVPLTDERDQAPPSEPEPPALRTGVVIPASHVDRDRAIEDLTLLAELGFDDVRIGLDWPWMQPTPDGLHGDAVEFYLGLAQAAAGLGLALQITMLDRTMPPWFLNEGGFTDSKWALHWWPRWVEQVADLLGDHVAGWVPMDNPLAIANRIVPNDPRKHGDVLDTLVSGWRDAWRLLRGGPPVSTCLGVEIVRPADQTIQAGEAARRQDQLRWRMWLQALSDGTLSIPGRADREVADLAGSCDVLGIMIRHDQETLGLLHRTAEQGPDRPVSVTLLLPTGTDADRELVVERYLAGVHDAESGMPLAAMAVTPAFDITGEERGLITRDRDLKDSGRRLLQR